MRIMDALFKGLLGGVFALMAIRIAGAFLFVHTGEPRIGGYISRFGETPSGEFASLIVIWLAMSVGIALTVLFADWLKRKLCD